MALHVRFRTLVATAGRPSLRQAFGWQASCAEAKRVYTKVRGQRHEWVDSLAASRHQLTVALKTMSTYLGHDFSNGKCVNCGAGEQSVRQFQTRCMPTNKPTIKPAATEPEPAASSSGATWEYRILSQRDQLFSGRFDSASITEVLNRLGAQGWRVVTVTSSGVNTLLGGNRDEILIFLERMKPQAVSSIPTPLPMSEEQVAEGMPTHYLEIAGTERGPFSVMQLRELLSGGRIEGAAKVRTEGRDGTTLLADILA